jgi:methionyl-tRNA formyltransferase
MSTYAPRLTKEDGLVDWSRPALDIHNLIRGLHPWPHAFSFHQGRRLILLNSMLSQSVEPLPATAPDVRPGTVLEAAGDRLQMATGTGPLEIVRIQSEGKRPMAIRDFLAGHKMVPGDRLTPHP